jgi:hypothetical protein
MSGERYLLIPGGVLDTVAGVEIRRTDPGWSEYLQWLAAGNRPGLPETLPVAVPVDRSYYAKAGAARLARKIAAMSDADYIAYLKAGGNNGNASSLRRRIPARRSRR